LKASVLVLVLMTHVTVSREPSVRTFAEPSLESLRQAPSSEPPSGASVQNPRPEPSPTPGIHYTPTRHAIADAMLQLAKVTASDVVFDLGSGDGRIVIIAAQKYGARGIGIELDEKLVEVSTQNARDAGVESRVTFMRGDLFAADLSSATVVALYLSPSMNRELAPKLERELKPGARVVTHQFPIPGWTPDERVTRDGSELFLYRMPAH